jgi:uncharacterized protein (DUF885 family)
LTVDLLADRFWRLFCEYAPTIATVRGEHEFNDRLRTFDPDALDDFATSFRSIGSEVAALDASNLTTQEQISAGLLAHESDVWATEIEQRFLVAPIDPYIGVHNRLLSDTRMNTVQSPEQADALLERYSKVDGHLKDALLLTRANASSGMTPALAPLERVLDQIDRYLGSGLDDDPFLKLKGGGPHWHKAAEDLVENVIRPAFVDYRAGLTEHIGPVARPHDRIATQLLVVPRSMPMILLLIPLSHARGSC